MTSNSQFIKTRYVAILLFVCVGLRMILFGIFQPWTPEIETKRVLQSDALGYHKLATTLIENHRFAYSSTEKPNSLRTPLYPMFIAAIYSLVGVKPWIVLLAQILIDSLSCFLLLVSLSRLFSRRVAFIASTLYALDPFLILYSSTSLYSDTLFVFFLVAGFWFFSLARHGEISNKTLLNYGLSSLFLGLATLTRPISLFIIACFVVFFLVAYGNQPKIALTYALLCSLIFGLVLLPWFFRNYLTFGYFSFSSASSENMLFDLVPMEMDMRHKDLATVWESLSTEADKMIEADGLNPQDLNDFQKGPYWQKLALSYISNDPIAFGKSYLLGIYHTLFNRDAKFYAEFLGLPAVDFDIKAYPNIFDLAKAFLEQQGAVGLLIIFGVIVLDFLIVYLGAIIGLLTSWKRYKDKPALLLIILIAVYFVLITGTQGHPRFRLPSIPFYLAFTGIGFSYLYEKVILAKAAKKHNLNAITKK